MRVQGLTANPVRGDTRHQFVPASLRSAYALFNLRTKHSLLCYFDEVHQTFSIPILSLPSLSIPHYDDNPRVDGLDMHAIPTRPVSAAIAWWRAKLVRPPSDKTGTERGAFAQLEFM